MNFETTPLFGDQKYSTFERLSTLDVTPTRSLNIQRDSTVFPSKVHDSDKSQGADNDYIRDPSTHSLATSTSESSFTTANSFQEYDYDRSNTSEHIQLNDREFLHSMPPRNIDDLDHYDDKTPIVTSNAIFDVKTPTKSDFAVHRTDTVRQQPMSPDGFSFERRDSQQYHNSFGVPTLTEADSSAILKSPELQANISTSTEKEFPMNMYNSSPLKAYRRSIASSVVKVATSDTDLVHSNIREAYTKSPTKLPTNDLLLQNDNVQDSHSRIISENFEDSTISHDETYLKELDKTQNSHDVLGRKNTLKKSSDLDLDEQNLAYLFIIAIHSFNSESLENKEDASICLSFEKNEVAFVHTVDESGWGEVTLIKDQRRGWVPFNYFSDTVKPIQGHSTQGTFNTETESRKPLSKLFSASAKFLLHPQGTPIPNSTDMSFSIEHINGIRDGVKFLLEGTNCVSRSNELVKNKPIVKKTRKRLLADWYNLMIKADSYKHTFDAKKIETLQKLVLKVVSRGCTFYDVWSFEQQTFNKEKSLGLIEQAEIPSVLNKNPDSPARRQMKPRRPSAKEIPVLLKPPHAISRLNEVHELLFTYIGLILGRLDMIEHNPAGCEILESIVHQIIVLLRELLYISKCCSSIVQTKYKGAYEYELDRSLDPLLALVSELVSCIKVFVTQTVNEDFNESNNIGGVLFIKDDFYYYTGEGEHLIHIVSKMTILISSAISGCNNYLRLIGDFELGMDREYPDFQQIKITPDCFIKKCSTALLKNLGNHIKLDSLVKESKKPKDRHIYSKKLSRYSTIRSGGKGASLTTPGSQFLQEFLPESKPFIRDSSFDQYRIKEDEIVPETDRNVINDRERMKQELVYGKDETLIGASFRSLVFMVTDEMSRPNNFLTSTFLLNFKLFSNPIDLIEELVARFDIVDKSSYYERGTNNGQYSSRSSRLKNRRKLVCKIFQIWMESYWDYANDSHILPTLINFFNEGISTYLPIEAKFLIEIAAKITSATSNNNKNSKTLKSEYSQLVPKSISGVNTNSMISIASSASSTRSSMLSIDEQFIEKYELAKLPTTNNSSISLPLPLLHVGTSSLLTKRNINDMERLVKSYRNMVSDSVVSSLKTESNAVKSLWGLINHWRILLKSTQAPPNLIHNDMKFVELNPLEVAKQLSLIESALFLAVKPHELLGKVFSSKKNHSNHCPNVDLIISFTNLLSNYVIESILTPNLSLKKRSVILKSWLNIALSALYFRNFNSVISIMAALQSHSLSRLSPIWDLISDKYLELYQYLSKVVHPNNNYKVYRTKLQQLTTGFSSQESTFKKPIMPMVPFFNLFLQDLTFIKDGNADFRSPASFRMNNIINIDKYFKVTKVISLIQFLQVGYDTDEKANTHSKRDSFFNLTTSIDIDTTSIKHVTLLQEFIMYELWRVNILYANDTDRSYKLSLGIVPRTAF